MIVKIKKVNKNAVLPFRATEHSVGLDVTAVSKKIIADGIIKYGTGIAIETSTSDIVIDCRARSSIFKTGLILSNGVGTGDPDYRGEYSFVFYKAKEGREYEIGDRIGQILFLPAYGKDKIEIEESKELNNTKRGDGGYGSTDF